MKKLILVSSLALTLSGCFSNDETKEITPIFVNTYTADQQIAISERTFQGTTVPADMTPLAFRHGGKLERLTIKSGDRVTKGEVLATLDTAKLKQQLQDAKAQRDLANSQFKRAETLKSKGMLSASEYDELKANQQLTAIQYKVLMQELKHSQIIAPFDGVVATIDVESYQNISSGETAFSIYKNDVIYVDVPVSEAFIEQLKKLDDPYDLKAEVHVKALNTNYEAKLKLFSAEPVAEIKGYLARFELKQSVRQLLPGTSALVAINIDQFKDNEQTAVLVPLNLLVAQEEQGDFSVWKVDESGSAELTEVLVSTTTAKGALVIDGVQLGDRLIASQLSKLTQGKEIQFVDGHQ
ncbi:efflux RND transporter periplasmic adaptor subunit [Vibrio comitans]|uniref:Membrane protein n=1 Tax=Vibrio comitans NBRC 102076 TaxID=1219078 RepID=A0A4Y3IJA1_9VIBR|nr:efflux RND transporter periplasmic adaptor subunit [Vibrio comitans]GEA59255.1 membrane protein [Vibrio comitans NBRC 102076]